MIDRYRNIGICAHIDAGKTSLTERILYFSGKKHYIGEVHNGETDMDWMDQEKERGITITSAVTTIFWSGIFNHFDRYKINIIDTPGHIDFTAEVERSLRILDGVCVVLCSVGGIQPQTKIIWNQINRYSIPRIVFINKLDRMGSNFNKVCKQIKSKLGIIPIVLQNPYYVDGKFLGIVDLLTLQRFLYDERGEILVDKNYYPSSDDINKKKLIYEYLVEQDDFYLNKYLENIITLNDILILIRRYTLSCVVVPVLCGSVLKNKGIQNVLDAIVNYLPSPLDLSYRKNQDLDKLICLNKFCALVFKVVNDDYSGKISFIRVYSGSLNKGSFIYNSSKKNSERIIRLLEIHANKRTDIDLISRGDIVAVVGLRKVSTGDTLCIKEFPIKLDTINFPNPVISILIRPLRLSDSDRFSAMIRKLSLEDPTIKITIDFKTKDIIVSGMGELHLDVFLEKVRRLSGVLFSKSKPSVYYKETISVPVLGANGKYIKQSGGRGQYGHVVLNAFPLSSNVDIEIIDKIKCGVIPLDYIPIIRSTINQVCSLGFLIGGKIVAVKFEIVDGSFHEVDSSELAFKLATQLALKYIFVNAKMIALEPIMKVFIFTINKYLGVLTAEILVKNGIVSKIINRSNDLVDIISLIPLRELFNFSTILRSKTKGSANFFMEFNSYKLVSSASLNKIINENND